MNELMAGAAIIDISPGKGIDLAGYPHFPRYNTGIHDPLFASCLYIKNQHKQFVMVTLDILFFSKKHVLYVRDRVEKTEGIPASNIMISCSHTHSGPWASGRLDSESLLMGLGENKEYVDELISKIIGIISEAKKNSFNAEIGFCKEYCGREQGIGGNRRDPAGPCDPYAYVMAARDNEGKTRCIVVNYALHPTLLHEDSTVVTADYPGYIRMALKEKYPEAVMLFAQGTSGNQSSRYFRKGQSFGEAERIGRTIASCVMKAIDSMAFSKSFDINIASEQIPIPLRKLPSRQVMEQRVKEDRSIYDHKVEANASYLEVQNSNLKLLGSEDLLGYVIMMEAGRRIDLIEDENPAEIQVATLGNLKLIGLPGEIFVEYGLEIKKQINGSLVIINELANGCLPGYVCTTSAYDEGGYEADTSLLDPEFGQNLVKKTVELAERRA
ncbi:MAG: neutral/alkaline non-lysosomal ceramidase N-terminal domain-containing protein [Spirochaetaceae bacterium]|nr:neutral/alkaline non-lysosomal ceramidase N-terminal domain-containing protein [Spirochaetaceae bacterium]